MLFHNQTERDFSYTQVNKGNGGIVSETITDCHDSGTVEWVTLIFPIEIISQSPLKWSWELC